MLYDDVCRVRVCFADEKKTGKNVQTRYTPPHVYDNNHRTILCMYTIVHEHLYYIFSMKENHSSNVPIYTYPIHVIIYYNTRIRE